MSSTNPLSTGKINTNGSDFRQAPPSAPETSAEPKSAAPIQIRTAARDYENPVDYDHPYRSMAQFANFLALRCDANRTRHAYYRQVRLIHEYFTTTMVYLHLTHQSTQDALRLMNQLCQGLPR